MRIKRARWACVTVIGLAIGVAIWHQFAPVPEPLLWGSICVAAVAAVLLGELDSIVEFEPVILDPAPLQLDRLDLHDGRTRWRVVNNLTGEQVGHSTLAVYTDTPSDLAWLYSLHDCDPHQADRLKDQR